MNVKIELVNEKEELVIRMPIGQPRTSASGKSLLIASSGGNVATTCIVQGQPLVVAVNAYIKK